MKTNGFTLVDLLITLALSVLLVTIAVPSYQAALIKNRRVAAQALLVDVAARQQFYLTQSQQSTNHCMTSHIFYCYAGQMAWLYPDDPRLIDVNTFAMASTGTNHYTLSVVNEARATSLVGFPCEPSSGSSPCFVVEATPLPTSPQRQDGKLAIDSLGHHYHDRDNDGQYQPNENSWGH